MRMNLGHVLLIGAATLVSCTEKSPEMPDQSSQEFLSGYDGQTTDELIGMASVYRIDSIVLAFEQALDQQRDARELTEEESWILAVEALEREVNNGGFLLFFKNSSREYAPTVVRALEIQGELTESAIESAIEAREEEISERLDTLDSEYYRQTESIADRLFEFIRANKARIRAKAG